MTQQTDDEARRGAPVELYELVGPLHTFRLTPNNWDLDADVGAGSVTFTAAAMKRGTVRRGESGVEEFQLELPPYHPLVLRYAFGIPEASLEVRAYRAHIQADGSVGEVERFWRSEAAGFSGKLPMLSLRCPANLGAALKQELPSVDCGPQCPLILGDSRCGVNLSDPDFDFVTTVDTFSTDGREITVASDDGHGDTWFQFGWAIRTADGEKRLILDHTGLVLTLIEAFSTLYDGSGNVEVWDEVELIAGCDHTLLGANGCLEKFDNVDNFRGYGVFMTGADPIRRSLKGT